MEAAWVRASHMHTHMHTKAQRLHCDDTCVLHMVVINFKAFYTGTVAPIYQQSHSFCVSPLEQHEGNNFSVKHFITINLAVRK